MASQVPGKGKSCERPIPTHCHPDLADHGEDLNRAWQRAKRRNRAQPVQTKAPFSGNVTIWERDGIFVRLDTADSCCTQRPSPTRPAQQRLCSPPPVSGPVPEGWHRECVAGQGHYASHHFHPGTSNGNELLLCHEFLNLCVEPRVPGPHPLKLLRLPEHRDQPRLPPHCSTLMSLLSATAQDTPSHPPPSRFESCWRGNMPQAEGEVPQREITHLGAGKGELRIALHQTDHRDPAPSTLTDSLLIWPQPGCGDKHGPTTVIAQHKPLWEWACAAFHGSARENARAKCCPLAKCLTATSPRASSSHFSHCLSAETETPPGDRPAVWQQREPFPLGHCTRCLEPRGSQLSPWAACSGLQVSREGALCCSHQSRCGSDPQHG